MIKSQDHAQSFIYSKETLSAAVAGCAWKGQLDLLNTIGVCDTMRPRMVGPGELYGTGFFSF